MHKGLKDGTNKPEEIHFGDLEFCPVCRKTVSFYMVKSFFKESPLYRLFVRWPEERKYFEPYRDMWE